jgi:gamma-glutamylputrescine oxidase
MRIPKEFNYSYWELKTFFKEFDLLVIGSGIVGLSTAISFLEKHPNASVLVLDQGWSPAGASTRNAGFACFGSPGELLSDLRNMNNDAVWETVEMRWKGLQILRKRIGDTQLNYEELGGYELFFNRDEYEACAEKISFLNRNLKQILGLDSCYEICPTSNYNFKGCCGIIRNRFEGQLDTSHMMRSLVQLSYSKNAQIVNNVKVTALHDPGSHAEVSTSIGTLRASRVVVATNGFAGELLKLEDVKPARAQVLITRPIANLQLKGAYHFDDGFYYFRNIDGRVLFGGGRNLDIVGETTAESGLNPRIHAQLDEFLKERILPGISFETETRWSGIMGVGREKKPIIKNYSKNIIAAVRMGGMGVAIGSLVGQKAALLAE